MVCVENMLLTSSHDGCLVSREICDVLVIRVDRFRYFDRNSRVLRGWKIEKERGREWADYVSGHGQA